MTEETINDIEEEWRSIRGFPNSEISSIGRIRNVKTGLILKPRSDTGCYLRINLCEKNIKKKLCVHRLVAQELIDNPDNKQEVDHIDHNPGNNSIDNLRWASRSENMRNKSKQQKPCSSCYKGVVWNKRSQKWKAQIMVNSVKKTPRIF